MMFGPVGRFALAAMLGCAIYASQVEKASANNALTVYIECKNPNKPELAVYKGTGVVISPAGHVLTAEHVMPDGYECEGALENNTLAKRQLQVDFKDYQLSDKIDGKLLRFIASSGEVFEYATYCAATDENVGDVIVVKGFHGKSRGLPSATLGILSTYIPDHRGILETDANTVGGKSGGPVFLQNTNTIIGIVAGAEFDPSGLPAYYGVLTAEALTQFGVLQKSQSCDGSDAVAGVANPTVDEPASVTGTQADAPETKLEITETTLSPKEMEAAMNLTWEDRKLVQESLSAIGFNTGGADGVWGANTRKAIASWQSTVGKDPIGFLDLPQKELLIASASARLDQLEASQSTSNASTMNNANATELFQKARTLVDSNQERQALPFLDKLIEMDPENANYLAWRGFAYYEVNQFSKALTDLNESLRLDPSDATAWGDRGWANMRLGNSDRAFSDFNKAIDMAPGETDSPEGLKVLCDQFGKC